MALAAAPLVLALLAIPAVESNTFEDWVRIKIERRASDALGAPVHLGSLQIRLASLQPRIEATSVLVDLPGEEVLRAERAVLFLRPLQLLGSRHLERLELDSLRMEVDLDGGTLIGLVGDADGATGRDVRIGSVIVKRGTLGLKGAGLDLDLEDVDALMTSDACGVVFDLRAAGRHLVARVGGVSVDEPIESFEGQIVVRPDALELRQAKLSMGALSAVVDAQAELDGDPRVTISHLEAHAPLALLPRLSPSFSALSGWKGTVDWSGPVSIDPSGFHAEGAASISAGSGLALGGTLVLDGTASPAAATGQAELAHSGVFARRTRVPDGTITGGFRLDAEGLTLRDVFATAGHSRVNMDGTISPEGIADLAFSAEPLVLDELSPIEGVDIAGGGPIREGRVRGTLRAPLVEGIADLAGFQVAGIHLGDGSGPVRISFAERSLSSPETRFVRGETAYGGPWALHLGKGRLDAGSRDRPIALREARLEDLLATNAIRLPEPIDVRGTVTDGSFWLSGPLEALGGGFRAKGRALDVSGQGFSSFDVRGRLDAGAVWLDDGTARRTSGAQLFARGRVGAAPERVLAFEVHTSSFTLADIDRFPTRAIASAVGTQLRIGGTLAKPDVRGTVRFEKTRVNERAIGDSRLALRTESGELRVEGSLGGGALTPSGAARLDGTGAHLTLAGRNGATFALTAGRVDERWAATGAGTLDLGLVALATDRFSRIEGLLDVKSLAIDGTHRRLSAEIREASVEAPVVPVRASAMTAAVSVEDGVVTVRELAGAAGGGTFRLAREATLVIASNGCMSRIDAAVELSGLTIRHPDEPLTARIRGPLRLEGGNCGSGVPVLAGDLTLEHLKYAGNGASASESASPSARAIVKLDIALSAPGGGIHVKNDLLKVELATTTPLRIHGDDNAWGVNPGALRLVSGRLVVQGLGFDLRKADVTFTGTRSIDGTYSLSAVKKIALWEITVHAEGRLSGGAPKVDFEASPPLSDDAARDLLEKTRLREQMREGI